MRAGPVGSHPHTSHERLWWAVAVLLVILFLLLSGGRATGQATPLTPAEQTAINIAIDRGVEYLRGVQNPNGSWGPGTGPGSDKGWGPGYTALAGLALAESGVPTSDPGLKRAADRIRGAAPVLSHTYEVALAILFLDRIGDKKDERVIQQLAARLIVSQTATGGWGYKVATGISPDAVLGPLRRLNPPQPADPPSLRSRPPSLGLCRKMGDDIRPRPPADAADPQKVLASLPGGLKNLPVFSDPARHVLAEPAEKRHDVGGTTDNSNTHFAILGLWAARRHGVPVERSFALLSRRFRTSQGGDGGWGYDYKGGTTPAMTCVSLLALAAGSVLAVDRGAPRVEQDPVVVNGFVTLGRRVGVPAGQIVNRPTVKEVGGLYYLWAIERIAVLYDLRRLSDKDWYRWGAEILVCHQGADGSWSADGGFSGQHPIVNTAFALMFLKRANLTSDLSRRLAVNTSELSQRVSERESPPPAPPAPVASAPSAPPPAPEESAPPPVEAPSPPSPVARPTPPPQPVAESPPVEPKPSSLPWVLGLVVLLVCGGVAIFFAVRTARQDDEEDEDERPRKKKGKKRPRARAPD